MLYLSFFIKSSKWPVRWHYVYYHFIGRGCLKKIANLPAHIPSEWQRHVLWRLLSRHCYILGPLFQTLQWSRYLPVLVHLPHDSAIKVSADANIIRSLESWTCPILTFSAWCTFSFVSVFVLSSSTRMIPAVNIHARSSRSLAKLPGHCVCMCFLFLILASLSLEQFYWGIHTIPSNWCI